MEKDKFTEKRKQLNSYIRFSGFGFQIIATLCLAAWGGTRLDAHFGLKIPVFLLVFLLVGLGGSLYIFIRQVTK